VLATPPGTELPDRQPGQHLIHRQPIQTRVDDLAVAAAILNRDAARSRTGYVNWRGISRPSHARTLPIRH
jgi:hypothetical protein